MDGARRDELVLQALETELCGVRVYQTALRCARNESLREEWMRYLEQTEHHARIVRDLCSALGLDPEIETAGRRVARYAGDALVAAMELALDSGDATGAELVAAECVLDAETKDHAQWARMGELGREEGPDADALAAAHEETAEEEDEHLVHARGWVRELWRDALGLPAALPPPEERGEAMLIRDAARARSPQQRRSA
jgi:hypothetical protein